MRKKILAFLTRLCSVTEFILAILVLVAIAAAGIDLIREIGFGSDAWISPGNFDVFLSHVLGLVIGVEFIKMLTRHTAGAVLEVLLFAIARQIIVVHTSFLDNLLGVLAVAGIFAIRKFIFVEHAKKEELPADSDMME